MWKKHLDYYMGDVYFTAERDGQVRELRFVFNTCIDSLYYSALDYGAKKANYEEVIDLAHHYTRFIHPQDTFDTSYELEALINKADFDFQLPAQFLKRG